MSYAYRLSGLKLASDFDLPGLMPWNGPACASSDIVIRLGRTPVRLEAADHVAPVFQTQGGNRYLLLLPGTGRMLELFGPELERGLGLDLSLDMLAMARARLDRAGLRHCSVRQGDIYDLALPRDSFDLVIIHQVLHFLDDSARAIQEAARVLRPAGRLLVVDFAPHDLEFLRDEHAHRRLGFAPETVTQWLSAAGLETLQQKTLPPEPNSDGKIAVSLWLGRDPRLALAGATAREVA